MRTITSFEADLHIDESALDIEWLNQPELTLKYTKMCADVKQEYDVAKEQLEYTRANLDKDIRQRPASYGLDKVTEGAILSAILSDDEYLDAQKDVDSARYQYDLMRGVVEAVQSKKEALENLVKLYGQNYFSGPKVPHDIISFRQTRAKKLDSSVSSKMAMKKKKKKREK